MVNASSVILWITLVTAIASLIVSVVVSLFKVHNWYLKQEEQDEEIKDIKSELAISMKCHLATLDGLQQLGCNHIVPSTRKDLEEYLNAKAHE